MSLLTYSHLPNWIKSVSLYTIEIEVPLSKHIYLIPRYLNTYISFMWRTRVLNLFILIGVIKIEKNIMYRHLKNNYLWYIPRIVLYSVNPR